MVTGGGEFNELEFWARVKTNGIHQNGLPGSKFGCP